MHSPTDEHYNAVKHVLRYLAGTPSHGIFFKASNPLNIHTFSDADWVVDDHDVLSTNGYVIYLGSHVISWSSKKQKGVAHSSPEAEYRAVANTASELRWLCSLITELSITLPEKSVIYCDSVGGILRIVHLSTKDQLADALTKPLARACFGELYNKIGITRVPPS